MKLKRPLFALGAALAAFIIVGVVVTELASEVIAFSLFVGIPAGIVAAIVVGAFVAVGLGPDASRLRRKPALGLGAFGVTFVLVLVLVAGAGLRNSLALPIAAFAAVIAGVATAVGSRPPTASE